MHAMLPNTIVALLIAAVAQFWQGRGDVPSRRPPPDVLQKQSNVHVRRGLVALHNFAYVEAAREFREAQRLDGGNAFGYWGEALTHFQPVSARVQPDSIAAV